MPNINPLLPDLRRLVLSLFEDLLERSRALPDIDAGLRSAYAQIARGGRTADAFEVWREDYLDQVAVAWVLSCVFVRFMEDNGLVDECWLAGDGERRKLAEDTHELYFREHPHDSDREYFEHVFREVGSISACRDLFAAGKTPLWALGPSGDMAMKLLAFWRDVIPETGELRRGFSEDGFQFSVFGFRQSHTPLPPPTAHLPPPTEHRTPTTQHPTPNTENRTPTTQHPTPNTEHRKPNTHHPTPPPSPPDPTRFLGDLYQDLSERARKKYALLQTPVFVEEFILDRTLSPAIDEFGLDEVRMIDPTCGSGHFLLGGFGRLFDLWIRREDNEVVAAQKALDGVWGCDINPFAVAIARFRLIVAALRACGITRLKDAPGWRIHLAIGDSLLFGQRWNREGTGRKEQLFLGTESEGSWAPEIYACEDERAINEVLGQQYHAVVGNPPYIVPKDKALNQAYRERYPTCHRKYSLAVPFMERFFDLAVAGGATKDTKNTNGAAAESRGAGYVGQITANSFMKREFGKKLIEEFFAKVDLTHVIDTSGAYIPGHGTPTVILFGRNRLPVEENVRAVLGIKGEPGTPADPSQGLVWQSIVQHVDQADTQDLFMSVADVSRATFASHPWSIGGGGASDLKERLEELPSRLGDQSESIGFMAITGEDEAFVRELSQWRDIDVPIRVFVEGDRVRDWSCNSELFSPFMYEIEGKRLTCLDLADTSVFFRECWMLRTNLEARLMFGKTPEESGLQWYEYRFISSERVATPLSIAFAFVATHNHFVLDRGGKVFKQSAPIIKLPADATEDDHLALLGLLNSSTACFWMKQVFFPKGGDHVGTEGARVRRTQWDERYEFAGTQLQNFPVPVHKPRDLAWRLDQSARELGDISPARVVSTWDGYGDLAEALRIARDQTHKKQAEMVALQEELDWRCYECYGLLDDPQVFNGTGDEPVEFGERAFEISMARKMENGELESSWFERHSSEPNPELPRHWQPSFRQVVEKRLHHIETNPQIALIESPEYKRRWNTEPWDDQQHRALKNWLLDRLETQQYWPAPTQHEPLFQTVAELADKARGDKDFLQVAAIYRGREDFNMAALVAELVEAESVPFLPVLRYKPTGLRKREVWEQVWELQRREDAGEVVGDISVPPKYTSADFLKSDYWRLRGKLDVPKERWVSYPHCETESDPSLVVGWAGWNHLQQATALIAYYDARKSEGWDAKRLTPLLAGLDQLLPWIHQWHPDVDPEFGETAGQTYETLLKSDAHELGLTVEDLRGWEPPAKGKGGGRPRKGSADGGDGMVVGTAKGTTKGTTKGSPRKTRKARKNEGEERKGG